MMPNRDAPTGYTPRVYFPNLNGLRFIAAFLVILQHVEQIKAMYGVDNIWTRPFIQIIGEQGVSLFFVLSGFLITYLMLEEEKHTGTIQVRNFYLRRILRIWPLYFGIGFLALVVLPRISLFVLPEYPLDVVYRHYWQKVTLYLLFLPNLMPFLGGIVPYASQSWSIGTEEQFYLLWPLLMKNIRRHRVVLMLFILLGYLLMARLLWSSHSDFLPFKYYINGFWSLFNIDLMAIGGLLAILLHTQSKYLRFVQNNVVFYAALLLVIYMLKESVVIQHVYKETYGLLYGLIILNVASNPRIGFNLETNMVRYLGKISYGLYMYHPIAIVLTLNLALWLGLATNYFIYPTAVLLTVGLAGFSYKYFESFFLKLKVNYSTVRSGEDVLPESKDMIQLQTAIRDPK